MSTYNNKSNNGNHAKRRENFGFQQPRENDSNVPMKYLHSEKKRDTATLYITFNSKDHKKYIPIYKDSTEEDFLETIQEFKTLLVNYPTMLEDDQQVANSQLQFQDCLRGETLRDYKRITQEYSVYTTPSKEENFASILWELTSEVMGDRASQDQMAYLRRTNKPRSLTVKKWISRIQNINALLPHMSEGSNALTKEQMIEEVIVPNIPTQYLREFRLHSNVNDSLRELTRKLSDIIPENDDSNSRRENKGKGRNQNNNPRDNPRDNPRGNGRNNNRRSSDNSSKTFKNECGIHKGHEWADCRQNPNNSGNRQNNDRGRSKRQEHRQNRQRQSSDSPSSRDETPPRRRRRGRGKTQENNANRSPSRESHESFRIERLDTSDDEDSPKRKESFKIDDSNQDNEETNGAEILLTIPAVNDHPKRTILCLLDSGSSSSLLNYDVANRNVNEKKRHKEVWDTQGGSFTTFAKTTLSNLQFPQFTTRRNFEAELHLFEKKKK